MISTCYKLHYLLRSALAGSLIALLGCQAAPAPTLAEVPPPPALSSEEEAIVLPESEQPVLLDEAPAGASPKAAGQASQRAFLPGLQADKTSDNAGLEENTAEGTIVPFEAELQKQRKRINLGLEREQRDEEPVDNVVNLQF